MSERYNHEDNITDFFYQCSEQVTRVIWNNNYRNNHVENNLDIDLLAMLFAVSDFTAISFNRRDIIINDLIPYIFETLPRGYAWWFNLSFSLTNEKFDERVDFYGKIIRKSIKLRAESLTVEDSNKLLENPLARCVIAFCDMLKNPKCINDYKNAPIALLGFSEDFFFTSEVTYPIIEIVMNYIMNIIDYCKAHPFEPTNSPVTNIRRDNIEISNTYSSIFSLLSPLIGIGVLIILAIVIGAIAYLFI